MGVEILRLGQIPRRIRSLPSFHAVGDPRRTWQLGSYPAAEQKAGQAECGTNSAARHAGVYLGHFNVATPTNRRRAEDWRTAEAEPFTPQEQLASAICCLRQCCLALARNAVQVLRPSPSVLPAVSLPSNQLSPRQTNQPLADSRWGHPKMGDHLGHGSAALIREQVKDIVVAHRLPFSRRLGRGHLRYASHDLALIGRVGPSRSGRKVRKRPSGPSRLTARFATRNSPPVGPHFTISRVGGERAGQDPAAWIWPRTGHAASGASLPARLRFLWASWGASADGSGRFEHGAEERRVGTVRPIIAGNLANAEPGTTVMRAHQLSVGDIDKPNSTDQDRSRRPAAQGFRRA